VDSGVYEGWNVPLEYDPLLAKLIAYGETRDEAIGKLRRALGEYYVAGVKTNLKLFNQILANNQFVAGDADTGLLARMTKPALISNSQTEIAAIAAAVFQMLDSRTVNPAAAIVSSEASAWKKSSRTEGLR